MSRLPGLCSRFYISIDLSNINSSNLFTYRINYNLSCQLDHNFLRYDNNLLFFLANSTLFENTDSHRPKRELGRLLSVFGLYRLDLLQ